MDFLYQDSIRFLQSFLQGPARTVHLLHDYSTTQEVTQTRSFELALFLNKISDLPAACVPSTREMLCISRHEFAMQTRISLVGSPFVKNKRFVATDA